jgi:DNA-binding MarR family transcriptional regulator
LTGEGQAIHAEVMPLALATERDLLAGFAPEQQTMLRDMLEAVRMRAGEMTSG